MGKNCFFIVMLLARCRKINKNRAMNETRILTCIEIYYSMLISRGSTAEELNEWLNGWDKNDSLFSSQISNHHLCRCSSLRIFISSFWFSSSPFIWKWLNRVSFFAFIPYEQGLLTWGNFIYIKSHGFRSLLVFVEKYKNFKVIALSETIKRKRKIRKKQKKNNKTEIKIAMMIK